MFRYSVLFFTFFCVCNGIYYDSYRGTVISLEEVKRYNKINASMWCVNDIKPCDPREGRRVDGSCNNLKNPSVGASNTRQVRLLPAVYDKDFKPKKTKSGKEMPLARFLRTSLLFEGRVPDQTLTQLATQFLSFALGDFSSAHDTINYIAWKTTCCTEKGRTDRECAPIKVPHSDPVFRFSDIRCLNLTTPLSFQFVGCTKNDTVPERVGALTTMFDLSQLYGKKLKDLQQKGRLFRNGLLKYEVENGRVWPPSAKTAQNICYLNQRPAETRCHDTPTPSANTLIGLNVFTIWTWRHHNKIASELAAMNPCWSDDRLFYTARDINTAIMVQIFLYEMLPILMGYKNLVQDSVLSSSPGFRDLYNPTVLPQLSLEFLYMWRYIHLMQEGALKMYDNKGHYLKKVPVVNMTMRTGFLAIDNNLDYLTQGSFRQASGKVDDKIVDPDIAGLGLGPLQRASDILSSDMSKNRLFGFQPYIKYKEYCTGKSYESFDSLLEFIDIEMVEILKDLYEDVEDIDLLAGLWMERLIDGGQVPPTFYCIVVEQLVRTIVSDRHWYERPNRPGAFDAVQLEEIRKANIARLLCDVGDSVSEIQPHAFLRQGPRNKITNCRNIPDMSFKPWKDQTCYNVHTMGMMYRS